MPTTCPGRAWWRPASSSTRTAPSSAPSATAAPTSTAPPRPSWSPSPRASTTCSSASARAGRCSSRPSACRPPVSRPRLRRCRLLAGRPGAPRRLHRDRRPPREPVHLTFLYLPPPDHAGRAERWLYERQEGSGPDTDAWAARVVPDGDRPGAGAAVGDPARGRDAHRCRDVGLPARHHLRQADRLAGDPRRSQPTPTDTPFLGGIEPKLGEKDRED